jgi:integrase
MKDGWLHQITYMEILKYHKRVAAALGKQHLGFSPEKIGTHSMRVTFATRLFEAGFSDAIIMAEGRWKSDAYLKYIRLNALRLGYNVTSAITSRNPTYTSIK